jgi:glycosyltransferase involved in cell wall biosynthesis
VRLLLIVDDYLPNSIKVAAKMMHDLALEFIARGHEVTVLTPNPDLTKSFQETSIDGVHVLYFKSGRIKNTSKIRRAMNESLLSRQAWKAGKNYFIQNAKDGIVYYSPTIFFGHLVSRLKTLWGCRSFLVLRDLFPQWTIDNGLINDGSLAHRYFRYFETLNYNAADTIAIMSPSNRQYFQKYPEHSHKLEVLYNWANPSITIESKVSYRKKLGLEGKVVFFYGGNIGHAQHMTTLLELAKKLSRYPDAHFLFIGKGDEVDLILKQKHIQNLQNITYLPPVSQNTYFEMLNEFDVGLFTLHPDHTTHNFPGKLLGYMQLGKPILGCVNKGNDLKELINTSGSGFVVDSLENDELKSKALLLLKDAELRQIMGKKGQELLRELFSANTACAKIEKVLKEQTENTLRETVI